LRSRFISRLSSRFCSFFSCFVIFSAAVADGLEAAFEGDVDVGAAGLAEPAVALAEAGGIGSTFRGWNCCACDLNFPCVIFSGDAEVVGTSGDACGATVI
jgi:hypothetical protein